ncbi:flagellum-specific ATP synthase [Lachnospiraceae bacterium PF1-21]|uniref:Flagellar protein export ATPase FliI n=1 Tax=Ohessyouella blattaphilus TaxID=2949333 RepID=A0ABT1EEJ1_9FIRM|nr:flagellar protein export ATPase FliI [Ohessyouella blattaphilus]MCP1109118.1 flagellar protein export ATPase FliI [Ohessyouella blattaphilus]MCR8562512.1 flagellar protein export ATPase FliI [Ohessyouella blattaphilus]
MLQQIPEIIKNGKTMNHIGRIENITGMTIEASGGSANIGDIVMVQNGDLKKEIPAEVVGVRNDKLQLMAYESMQGVGSGCYVTNTKKRLKIPVGNFLRGRIIDALGNPLDDKGPFESEQYYYVENTMINPLSRPPIREELGFGVKAIDGLNTVGKGQRIGIFAGSGVGKSTLLGMIARNVEADINVIALVGERGREVREFIEKDLGPEGMKRSILVVATSDQPAMMRMKCPLVATTIAEFFRDQGKNVLLMMDSLTRFAMAHREIGLATGEPPIARGYTPSIYAEFPKLLERSGMFEKGSITGVYTVLVEGDDTNEPVADTVRGILDGHIVLTRKLANRGHFPAIDISASISRLMTQITEAEHRELAAKIRDIISLYEQNEDLIAIGAYKAGTNPKLDEAINKIEAINNLCRQQIEDTFTRSETVSIMKKILT